ncbi:MAG: hypothetical protein ACJASY_000146 [Halioglobus sp.]|jgi:hypothetical protein
MTLITRISSVLILSVFGLGAQAASTQSCIVEGTVKNHADVQRGTNVYVSFHSAKDGAGRNSCRLAERGKVAFKEPKNAMIENVPPGSKVRYQYTQEGEQAPQWQLMNVSVE